MNVFIILEFFQLYYYVIHPNTKYLWDFKAFKLAQDIAKYSQIDYFIKDYKSGAALFYFYFAIFLIFGSFGLMIHSIIQNNKKEFGIKKTNNQGNIYITYTILEWYFMLLDTILQIPFTSALSIQFFCFRDSCLSENFCKDLNCVCLNLNFRNQSPEFLQQTVGAWYHFVQVKANEFLEKFPKQRVIALIICFINDEQLQNHFKNIRNLERISYLDPSLQEEFNAYILQRKIEQKLQFQDQLNAKQNQVYSTNVAIYQQQLNKVYQTLEYSIQDVEESYKINYKISCLKNDKTNDSSQNQRRMFEQSGILIIVGNHHNFGQILHINSEITKKFGYLKKQLIGQHFDIFVPKSIQQRHTENLIQYINQNEKLNIQPLISTVMDDFGYGVLSEIQNQILPSISQGIKIISIIKELQPYYCYPYNYHEQSQKAQKSQSQKDYIYHFISYDQNDMQIIACSQSCYEFFGIHKDLINQNTTNALQFQIDLICPEIIKEGTIDKLKECPEGVEFTLDTTSIGLQFLQQNQDTYSNLKKDSDSVLPMGSEMDSNQKKQKIDQISQNSINKQNSEQKSLLQQQIDKDNKKYKTTKIIVQLVQIDKFQNVTIQFYDKYQPILSNSEQNFVQTNGQDQKAQFQTENKTVKASQNNEISVFDQTINDKEYQIFNELIEKDKETFQLMHYNESTYQIGVLHSRLQTLPQGIILSMRLHNEAQGLTEDEGASDIDDFEYDKQFLQKISQEFEDIQFEAMEELNHIDREHVKFNLKYDSVELEFFDENKQSYKDEYLQIDGMLLLTPAFTSISKSEFIEMDHRKYDYYNEPLKSFYFLMESGCQILREIATEAQIKPQHYQQEQKKLEQLIYSIEKQKKIQENKQSVFAKQDPQNKKLSQKQTSQQNEIVNQSGLDISNIELIQKDNFYCIEQQQPQIVVEGVNNQQYEQIQKKNSNSNSTDQEQFQSINTKKDNIQINDKNLSNININDESAEEDQQETKQDKLLSQIKLNKFSLFWKILLLKIVLVGDLVYDNFRNVQMNNEFKSIFEHLNNIEKRSSSMLFMMLFLQKEIADGTQQYDSEGNELIQYYSNQIYKVEQYINEEINLQENFPIQFNSYISLFTEYQTTEICNLDYNINQFTMGQFTDKIAGMNFKEACQWIQNGSLDSGLQIAIVEVVETVRSYAASLRKEIDDLAITYKDNQADYEYYKFRTQIKYNEKDAFDHFQMLMYMIIPLNDDLIIQFQKCFVKYTESIKSGYIINYAVMVSLSTLGFLFLWIPYAISMQRKLMFSQQMVSIIPVEIILDENSTELKNAIVKAKIIQETKL
ncbi:PAS domain [Pseudocohnilembus persalinus]|uniref:PAS domain n=1 Tax=Pseudocohnilembus persalinus TaxID=266149 RepID=A0A0V0R091_PSEPJ|nr:PAS domain [Pseudocohnilembus persalinus]|eukprot:KRX07722.1 PAS domain [Pseudocohnilembus persalinus]